MPVTPWLERLVDSLVEGSKIDERPGAFIVITADGGFGDVTMAVTERVVAFAIKLRILGIRKSGSVQAVGGTKWHAQTEENGFVIPKFSKKIITLMQSNAVQRQERITRSYM